ADQIHHHARLVEIGTAVAFALYRYEHDRLALWSIWPIWQGPVRGFDSCFQSTVVEETIRNVHDLGMHAVLRFKQCDGRCIALESFEHRMREAARSHHGRKLAVIADQNETACPQDQAERERLCELSGLIDDRHLEGPRSQIWKRRCAMRRCRHDLCSLERLFDGSDACALPDEVICEEVRWITFDFGNELRGIRRSAHP